MIESIKTNTNNDITDLEWSLYNQIQELNKKVKQLEFMIDNGLGWEANLLYV